MKRPSYDASSPILQSSPNTPSQKASIGSSPRSSEISTHSCPSIPSSETGPIPSADIPDLRPDGPEWSQQYADWLQYFDTFTNDDASPDFSLQDDIYLLQDNSDTSLRGLSFSDRITPDESAPVLELDFLDRLLHGNPGELPRPIERLDIPDFATPLKLTETTPGREGLMVGPAGTSPTPIAIAPLRRSTTPPHRLVGKQPSSGSDSQEHVLENADPMIPGVSAGTPNSCLLGPDLFSDVIDSASD